MAWVEPFPTLNIMVLGATGGEEMLNHVILPGNCSETAVKMLGLCI